MRQTEHFINRGYGWMCRLCGADGEREAQRTDSGLARFFREGEAEEREPRLSTPTLARWKDDTRRTLVCTRCGVEEELNKMAS